MIIEICLALIAIGLISLVIVLIKLSHQTQRSINLLQSDLHSISKELTRLIDNINEFVQTDLHQVSKSACGLVDNLTTLSSDLSNKSRTLNFLFRPFHFLNSRLSSKPNSTESTSKSLSIPQIVAWIASGIYLLKTTKEFIKNGKSK